MNVRQFPAQEDRVETGAIQFGEDWPGFFLRGKHALFLAGNLKMLIEKFPVAPDDLRTIESLMQLEEIAQQISHEVPGKG